MNYTEKIANYISAYYEKVNLLEEKITAANQRIEEIKLEIRYLKIKEMPEALIKRVLENEPSSEAKLIKKLQKLESELAEKEEESLVLSHSLQQYRVQSAEELKQYQQLFNDERKIATDNVYSKLQSKKKEYINAMKTESAVLHKYHDMELQMQGIEVEGGLKSAVYSFFPVDSKTLALTDREVTAIIKN